MHLPSLAAAAGAVACACLPSCKHTHSPPSCNSQHLSNKHCPTALLTQVYYLIYFLPNLLLTVLQADFDYIGMEAGSISQFEEHFVSPAVMAAHLKVITFLIVQMLSLPICSSWRSKVSVRKQTIIQQGRGWLV